MRFAVLAVLAVSGLAGGEISTDKKALFKRLHNLHSLDMSANFLKERHFAIRHSFEGSLIDLAHIRCALRDPTFLAATAATPPRAVTFFKLEKTGGTSVASSIVSSCVARMCADGRTPCDVSAGGLDVACAGDMIACKGLVENEDRERTPLWRAIKACAKLPLLVNKGTVDAYERHGELCYVSPSPHACVVTPYRDFLIVFREPRARLVSWMYYVLAPDTPPAGLSAADVNGLVVKARAKNQGFDLPPGLFNASLEDSFVVGIEEALPAFKVVAALRLGLPVEMFVACGTKRLSLIPHAASDLSKDARAALDAHAAPELALYTRAKAVAAAQRAAVLPLFESTRARLRDAQARLDASCDCGNKVFGDPGR